MTSPASFARHPIHPMLVPVPIGLWLFSLVSDIIYLSGGAPIWLDLAFYTMAGGIIGALAAAIPGLVDFLSLRERKTSRIAAAHMTLNLTLVVLYAVNLWLRTRPDVVLRTPFTLSIIGIVLLVISGWLGGELVYVHGVAVEEPRLRDETRIETRVRPDIHERSA